MYRTLTIAALLLAAACSQQDKAAAPSSNENEAAAAEQASAPAKTVPSLEGQWSVTAIDGKPLTNGSGMSATFEGSKAILAAGCIRRAWTYSQKGNLLSFATDPDGSANCGGGTSGEQETAFAALEKTSMVIFAQDGEASLSGTGGNLTLRRR